MEKVIRGLHHVTDPSNASRTLLLELRTGAWSPELCELFGVPVEALPEVAAKVLGMIRSSDAKGSAAAMRGRAARPDYAETLRAVRVPTLIVAGSDDAFDHGAAERMHALVPHSRFVRIDGAGHTPSMERPDEFNRVLTDFLAGLPI